MSNQPLIDLARFPKSPAEFLDSVTRFTVQVFLVGQTEAKDNEPEYFLSDQSREVPGSTKYNIRLLRYETSMSESEDLGCIANFDKAHSLTEDEYSQIISITREAIVRNQ